MKKLLHPAPSLREKLWRFVGALLLSLVLWLPIAQFVYEVSHRTHR